MKKNTFKVIKSMYDLEVMHVWDVQKKAFQFNITNTHNLPCKQIDDHKIQVGIPSLELACIDENHAPDELGPRTVFTTLSDVAKEIYYGFEGYRTQNPRRGMSMLKLHSKVTARIEETFGVKFKYKMAFYAFGYKNEFIAMVDRNVGKVVKT